MSLPICVQSGHACIFFTSTISLSIFNAHCDSIHIANTMVIAKHTTEGIHPLTLLG